MFARWHVMLHLMLGIGRAGLVFRTVSILMRFAVLDTLRKAGFLFWSGYWMWRTTPAPAMCCLC